MARTNWRHITPTTSRHAGAASEDLIRIDRIELELIRKGVPSESSGTLARQVERQLRGIPEDAAGLVLVHRLVGIPGRAENGLAGYGVQAAWYVRGSTCCLTDRRRSRLTGSGPAVSFRSSLLSPETT